MLSTDPKSSFTPVNPCIAHGNASSISEAYNGQIESQVTSVPNLASSLLGGRYLQIQHQIHQLSSLFQSKSEKKYIYEYEYWLFFSTNTNVPEPQVSRVMYLALLPSY